MITEEDENNYPFIKKLKDYIDNNLIKSDYYFYI